VKYLLICCLLLLFSAAHALDASHWETAFTLDAGYRDAERALTAANDDLKKVQADPDAAPLTLVRAQEKLAEAQAGVRQAKIAATVKAFTAVGDVLGGRRKQSASTTKLAIAEMQLQSALVRQKAGMISDLELARAKEDQAQAATDLGVAQRELRGAEARMKLYLDEAPEKLEEPPTLDITVLTLGDHPTLLAARHRLNEAERALALAQGPDTAPLDLAARERDRQSAKDAYKETEQTLTEALAAARRRYLAACEAEKHAMEGLKLATTDLQSAQKRHTAGSVSDLAFKQAEMTALTAELTFTQALVELWQARIAVIQATGGAL